MKIHLPESMQRREELANRIKELNEMATNKEYNASDRTYFKIELESCVERYDNLYPVPFHLHPQYADITFDFPFTPAIVARYGQRVEVRLDTGYIQVFFIELTDEQAIEQTILMAHFRVPPVANLNKIDWEVEQWCDGCELVNEYRENEERLDN